MIMEMWKAAVILAVTIVISFNETFAKESANSENDVVLSTIITSTTENSLIDSQTKFPVTSKIPTKPHFEKEMVHVTYDQRQEGQYNVRADLENFLIVVVPPNPIAGVNLIDLLTRSSVQRSNLNKGHKKRIFQKINKTGKGEGNLNYQTHQQYSEEPQPSEYFEYIEGRTPYRVDISSENEFPKAHPHPQVEVLPPTHPLHSHLMKPYHLDPEQSAVKKAALITPKQENYVELEHNEQKRSIDNESYEDFAASDNKIFSDFFGSINMNDVNENQTRGTDELIDLGLKLIGATEQCGPDRIRDIHGICQFVFGVN